MIPVLKEVSVVVAGRWNTGILTPSGIAKRLLAIPEGTPLELQINIEDLLPFRLKHGHVYIQCDSRRFACTVDGSQKPIDEENKREGLKSATAISCKAIENLPETPFAACGINFQYEISDLSTNTLSLLKQSIENSISDKHLAIAGRSYKFSLKDEPGIINLELILNEKGAILMINFHRDSTKKEDLLGWLQRTDNDLFGKVDTLIEVLKLNEG